MPYKNFLNMILIKNWRILRHKFAKLRILGLIIGLLILIYFRKILYLRFYGNFYVEKDALIEQKMRDFSPTMMEYRSKCKCRQNETVYLIKTPKDYRIEVDRRTDRNDSPEIIRSYSVEREQFETSIFTCGMFNSLRRGPNQRVISYTLYGTDRNYYNYVRDLIMVIREKYPDWIVRIHYDSSIYQEFICEIECMTYVDAVVGGEVFFDIVDFCDIERLPYDTTKTYNASYMHGMLSKRLKIKLNHLKNNILVTRNDLEVATNWRYVRRFCCESRH